LLQLPAVEFSCRDAVIEPVPPHEIEGGQEWLSPNGSTFDPRGAGGALPPGLSALEIRRASLLEGDPETKPRSDEVLFEGVVHKRGQIFQHFHERYFKLCKDKLVYARTTTGLTLGSVVLGKDLTITKDDGLYDGRGKDEEGLFLFSIRDASYRSMYCACDTAAERDEWVEKLRAATALCSENARIAELLHEDESQALEQGAGEVKIDDKQRARAWFFPELPWGAPPSWQLAGSPQTEWLLPWEIATSLACIYVGVKVPYASFMDNVKEPGDQVFSGCALLYLGKWSDESSEGGWKTRTQSVCAGLDLTCDVLFLLDMGISFLTARWIIDTEGREHWRLVDDLASVRKMYMWPCKENRFAKIPQFWIDFLGVIPWQYADCLLADSIEQSVIKGIRVLKMIKLSRLFRLQRLISTFRFKFPGQGHSRVDI
jgi:hypothetical protein